MADKTDSRDSDPGAEHDEDAIAKSALPKSASAKTSSEKTPAKKAATPAKEEESDESDDESDDGESDDESDDESDKTQERDESTRSVAKSLGIDDEEEDAASEDEGDAEKAATNRAARRREEAQKRRQARELAKKGGAKTKSDDDDVATAKDAEPRLPKDKNARAKELLKRRQEASTTRGVQLGATELVQDSLARAGSATAKALRKNIGLILTVLGLGTVGAIGYVVWSNHKEATIATASDELMRGVAADRAPTQKEDKRTDEEKKNDLTPFYTSNDVRTDTALAAYKKVVDEDHGSGPTTLAMLGQAGVLLEKAQFDQALDIYGKVVSSQLASADTEVKARATEGIGFAREGKGDLDGALASFKELEAIKGFDDLGNYHQGRILLRKGQVDAAKDKLTTLQKKIDVPTLEAPQQGFLTEAVNELLSTIDPKLARRQNMLSGMRGNSMTTEEQAEAQKRAIDAFKKQLEKQTQEHPGGSPMPMPGQPMPGQPMPGQPMPGQPMPGQDHE